MENSVSPTTKLKFKPSICKTSISEVFTVKGVFTLKRIDSNKPSLKITGPSGTIPLRWVFYKGGLDSNDADETNSFILSGLNGTTVISNPEVMLSGFNLGTSLNFSITISCDMTAFTVAFNEKWTETIGYNATNLNEFTEISIAGAVSVQKAGYGGKVNGLLFTSRFSGILYYNFLILCIFVHFLGLSIPITKWKNCS